MNKRFYEIEGTITALTPIFHGGDEKTGSTPVLRTIMVYVDGIGEVPIPYLSGNGIRGKLRRLSTKDFLDMLEYEITNTKLHHALFSGGVLESTSDTTGVIDLAFRKKVRELMPPVAIFGCALGNQMIQGNLIVEHMWPICEEYKLYLPEEYQKDPRTNQPIRTFTDQSFITRRDDLREERAEDEQAVQMKVDYECFVPGTKFYHRFVLQLPDQLQLSCFGRVLDLFEAMPYVGGRSSSGDGKVMLSYKNKPEADLYLEFVKEKKDDIVKLLKELEERL
ncbi:hypothetical protein KVG29_05030 [Caldicoprobacter algeriensis]|uniref:hypothetical protein n=1 Tax=Caldicoprobacter algeriensis TaxID=699281 RepID=UPI002079559E|nr:hypothetical protein [Caldicoprobacter algeriensis]MCM8900591.1 hypothetical protein [Caldicoprobacter algeriensis]